MKAPADGSQMIVGPSFRTAEPVVGLSFDDGPSEWTEKVLDLLAASGARATFFVLGGQVAGREQTLRRALAEGHELGVHTWTHPHLTSCTDGQIRDELVVTREAIALASGQRPRFWRAPYFEADKRVLAVAHELGLVACLCSIGPEDYHWPSERTAAFVLARLKPGAIVDLHDGRPTETASDLTRSETVAALERILREMGNRGYRGLSLSELLALGS